MEIAKGRLATLRKGGERDAIWPWWLVEPLPLFLVEPLPLFLVEPLPLFLVPLASQVVVGHTLCSYHPLLWLGLCSTCNPAIN